MDYDKCGSLPAMFFAQAARLGNKPFLWQKAEGRYRPLSWKAAQAAVRRLASGLAALGVARGDRVALVAENRPEWVVADFAIMSAGAVTVPAYTTNSVEAHRHVFADSGAVAVIVSKPALS
ncbi:MAG TPA: AMP-binding protein, partial [Stellaceae bacterium]|nr:AMP-binding protein [Stellaceae bacterium]